MMTFPCDAAGRVDPSCWRCGKVSFSSRSVPEAKRVLPSGALLLGGCRRGWKWPRLVRVEEEVELAQPQMSADRAWQNFSVVTRAMVCMRLTATGSKADFPDACSEHARDRSGLEQGEQPPKQDDSRRRGMVARRRRNTLLTRWAPLVCRARRVRLLQRASSRAVRAVSAWSCLSRRSSAARWAPSSEVAARLSCLAVRRPSSQVGLRGPVPVSRTWMSMFGVRRYGCGGVVTATILARLGCHDRACRRGGCGEAVRWLRVDGLPRESVVAAALVDR